jgi:hypothetical protein
MRQYLLTTEDADRWRATLPARTCVMGSVEYARIVERHTGASARLMVVESQGCAVAYPFLLRRIDALPFASGLGGGLCDTSTPEYTGPLRIGRGPHPALVPRFADLFARYCREHRIVAEFAHLNPWCPDVDLLEPSFVEADREVVWLDLTQGEEAIWMRSLSSDARRMTRKAQQAGLRVRHAGSPDDIRAFHRIYSLTMERRRALEKYFFPLDHFMAFFETMADSSFFALAEHEERLVAGGLFLHDATDVYWHLSAADLELARTRPVNGYVWETIRWALGQGKKRMLCGGGYEPGDGVFRFKAGFSPLRARFRTYKRTHDVEAYEALTRAWSAHHGGRSPRPGWFPAYRSA